MSRPSSPIGGLQFGRWTAIEFVGNKRWKCRCECGTEANVQASKLKNGQSRSCGCLQKELIAERNAKHGMCDHPAYESWSGAKRRCVDPTRAHYSQKGIRMHPDWLDFNVFWAAMGPTWELGLSIDRIDNAKGYEPGNCRWSTAKVQSNNRSSCVMIDTPRGRMNVTQAGEVYGLSRWTIAARLRAGWSDEDAVKPVEQKEPT